jgi:hypothetical protein
MSRRPIRLEAFLGEPRESLGFVGQVVAIVVLAVTVGYVVVGVGERILVPNPATPAAEQSGGER